MMILVQYTLEDISSIRLMVNTWKQFNGARSAYNRLNALLDDFPEDKEYMELPPPKGELLLEQVW